MKLRTSWCAALAACLAWLAVAPVKAANNRQYQMAGDAAESAISSYGSVEECSNYECWDSSSSNNLGWGQSGWIRGGQFFVGGEYLNVRSTFSEANGLIVITNPPPLFPPPLQIDYIPIEFDYDASYRFYGGYRWGECGEEIIFTYTRFQSDSDFDSGPGPGGNVVFRDPHQEVPVGPNDRVLQDVDVDVAVYDLAIAKTIPVCSCYQKCCDPCCGNGCDTCCDTCCDSGCGGCDGCGCCCPCPAWDFQWRAGVRFADVNWDRTGTVDYAAAGAPNRVSFTSLEFDGGGPRVGLTGRRYCGQSRIFSIYASSDAAILLGDIEMVHSQDNGNIVTTMRNTQLFPVLDLEAGGTIQLTQNLTVSAGYLFSAWFDLGMRDTIVPLAANQGAWWDDANILGFDGLFARAELAF